MPIIESYVSAWKLSFEYQGRSSRKDFWWFVLGNLIANLVIGIVSARLQSLFIIASLVPGIPLAVRRLRDIGKQWPWLLIGLVPVIGAIWLIILYCQPSIEG
jgi:uncharacterized membrane protein YhaH (DUF805 family)